MKFIRRILDVLKKVAIPLYLTVLILGSLDDWFSDQVQGIIRSSDGFGPSLWVFALLSFALSAISPVLIGLMVIFAASQEDTSLPSLFQYLRRFFNQSLIEQVRAIGKCLGWSLLLILPAIVRFVQLVYVTIVVAKDKDYWEGKKDALKASTQVTNKNFFKTLGLLIALALLPALLLAPMGEYKILWQHPLLAMGIALAQTLVSTSLMVGLLQIWERQNGTHV